MFASNLTTKERPHMNSVKYIGMDVHKEAISVAVQTSSASR